MEKMSVHRGLGELKLLDKKILKLSGETFIALQDGENNKINGTLIKEVEGKITSTMQSVEDLIKRRSKIKSAIIQSNATTIIDINGEKRTVAEWIDLKDSIRYNIDLKNRLESQYKNAIAVFNKKNSTVKDNADKFINNLYTDKNSVDPEKIKSLREDYIKKNSLSLIDPINIEKKIEELSEYIFNFQSEIDYKLSESNAITMIKLM